VTHAKPPIPRIAPAVLLALTTGAAARLARLTTRDKITEPVRARLHELVLFNPAQRRARAAGKPVPAPTSPRNAQFRVRVHQGLTCDWCVGVWWSAAISGLLHLWGHRRLVQAPIAALAAAYAVGLLVEHESQRPTCCPDHDHQDDHQDDQQDDNQPSPPAPDPQAA
jgi:hypothetical protein